MTDAATLHVTTRKAWRAWLRKNHARDDVIWLVYHKKHTGEPSVPYDDAVEEALCFGWIDSTVRTIDERRYMQKFTPRKAKSKWSPSNRARVAKLIADGAMTGAGMSKVEAAKRDGTWNATDAREVSEVPEELHAALKNNDRARVTFEALPPSHKKAYVRWVGAAKRAPTRERRAAEAAAMLAAGKPLGMK